MYRIDNLTAIPYLPTTPPSAAPGFFTDGNPAAALEATVVDAWWLNQLQEEILTVIGAAGIVPDKGRHSQLWEALQALFLGVGAGGNYLPLTGGTLYRPGGSDILVMNVDEGHEARILFSVANTHMWGLGTRPDGLFEIGDWNIGGARVLIDEAGTFRILGAAIIDSSLTISGEGGFNALSGQIWNNFRVNGEMSALGDINSSARIAAHNAWIGGGGLSVAGGAVVNGELWVGGPFSAPSADIPGNLVVGGDLHLPSGGNAFITGSVQINGDINTSSNVNVYRRVTAAELDISNTLSAVPERVWVGTTFEAPQLRAHIGGVEVFQGLLVHAAGVFDGSLTSQGAVISGLMHTDTILTNNAATIGTMLTVNGAATIGGALRANGNRILSYGGNNPAVAMVNSGAAPGFGMWVGGNPGRLTIGTVDTAGNPLANLVYLNMDGTFNVLGALEVGGGINANDGLNIGGQCHFHSDLQLNGQGTFDGTFRTGSDAIVGNNLVVSGTANFNAGATVVYGLSVGQGISIAAGGDTIVGNVSVSNNFGVGGASDLSGPMNLYNTIANKLGGGPWLDLYSDSRVKKAVQPYEAGLAEIGRLRPISYEYNGLAGTPDDGTVLHGLIAQDAVAVMPEMATAPRRMRLAADDAEETDIMGLDTGPITFALVNAVQELSARLEALETRRTT